jgi:hypothetical protein
VDKQAEAIYDFEDRFPWANHNNATLAQCRSLIAAACAAYGVRPPTVTQHKKRAMSWCMPVSRRISLQACGPDNKGGKNAATALHEAAHQIVFDLCGNRVDDHGPTFAGVYFHLLTMCGWPAAAIRAVAREHGVRWVERPPAYFARTRRDRRS